MLTRGEHGHERTRKGEALAHARRDEEEQVDPVGQTRAHTCQTCRAHETEHCAGDQRGFEAPGPRDQETRGDARHRCRQRRHDETKAGACGALEKHRLEVEGYVEEDGVVDDGAEEVGEDEAGTRLAPDELERHDGKGDMGFDPEEGGEAQAEDEERCDDERMRPCEDVATEVLYCCQPPATRSGNLAGPHQTEDQEGDGGRKQ